MPTCDPPDGMRGRHRGRSMVAEWGLAAIAGAADRGKPTQDRTRHSTRTRGEGNNSPLRSSTGAKLRDRGFLLQGPPSCHQSPLSHSLHRSARSILACSNCLTNKVRTRTLHAPLRSLRPSKRALPQNFSVSLAASQLGGVSLRDSLVRGLYPGLVPL